MDVLFYLDKYSIGKAERLEVDTSEGRSLNYSPFLPSLATVKE